jgi:uncharacterized membrane protein
VGKHVAPLREVANTKLIIIGFTLPFKNTRSNFTLKEFGTLDEGGRVFNNNFVQSEEVGNSEW